MKQILTYLRYNWASLLFLAALIFSGFLVGVVYSLTEIDNTIADYIEANGCPVKGEDW
tara:strand:+ start:71 stop:244 length:174 start_codon:yes stop_codon:yes gene_type:complete